MAGDETADPFDRRGAPSLAAFDDMAAAAFRRLPSEFRALCEDLVIRVDDFPSAEVVHRMRVESRYSLLGLFHGIGLPFRSVTFSGQMPNMIWLYRRPILAYWALHDDTLEAIITHVLVHEIGHHFGLSDPEIEAIERAAD
jgi:predicted Zn-dependent protease with MMP-like domain